MSKYPSRRNFIQKVSTSVLGAMVVPEILKADGNRTQQEWLHRNRPFSPNDNIQIALIGAGGMGFADANVAGIMAAVQSIQSRLDLVERNISDKLKEMGNIQSTNLTQLKNVILEINKKQFN